METKRIVYDDKVVRAFILASVVWGVVGMLVGVIVALQLAWWPANVHEMLSFGRLRPLHTNAVIFAFVGNMIFAGVYHSTQRLLKARTWSDKLTWAHFWGWQAIIVAAAITLPLGLTQGKEYAELIWPIDVAVAVVWLVFATNFFMTLKERNEKHLYVAIWFYIATIVTITVLYVVNNLQLPTSLGHSYGVFAGVQDALVQWWYGHNAVAFFLTTPILGIMYYYLPKAAERPVYSYRLSIIHFWSLVFIYIWAGPHHLLNTALPDWAQTLGMIFSVMLWAPSWGGMLNGLLTLRGAWDKLRDDPVLKFFAAAVTFYGMATFEGPMLSIRSVSSLAHYTDWIIGHVHAGALGWNGFMAAGMFYWLVPRLYGRELYSKTAANWHFWIGTFGILLYIVAMYISGVTQGLMWRAEADGGGLLYPNFVETVTAIVPMYWMRLIGGSVYLLGFVVLGWNLLMTARHGKPVETAVEVPVEPAEPKAPWQEIVFGKPVMLTFVVGVLVAAMAVVNELASTVIAVVALAVALLGTIALGFGQAKHGEKTWHGMLEGRGLLFTVLTVVAVLIGGVAEILPSVAIGVHDRSTTQQQPYTALELEGRDVYVSEGCYTCHSQMIRPFTWESARFGAISDDDDSLWDYPFQWGSKRTGPDLAREGGRYPDLWHVNHMLDPRSTSPGSIMPAYAHLATNRVAFDRSRGKLLALQNLGVPYSHDQVAHAADDAREQARGIAESLSRDVEVDSESELIALVAYLQRLGRVRSEFEPSRASDGEGGVEVSRAGGAR
ncbi:cytochrome-c oxidase, cbb3-type subunit I [Sandaracinus amylolyticus]|uniref:cytochrome-c oxidase, cbb3-type subunit I n=1 Tax=Sandaracinus amylolyticus TaxID=927083 RepID=UPI001F00EE13|nr:cytochrome-c oxidase, cbb3-type subunit I [Sandaracinus amylolyticus]UJR79455.1 Cytochrome c oxidase subunit CcoN [Sandaracinus amylolyticus]